MIKTTLNRIRAHSPCQEGWEKLLNHLGKTKADDEPLPYAIIVTSNGMNDALWCCRAEPQYAKELRLFAVACARRVEHLNSDPRVKNAIDVAERYAHGKATIEELNAARAAARAATWDAARAAAGYAAAWYAADAAWDATDATWDAAWDATDATDATWDAAGYAADAALDAARAAARAATDAARYATWDAALDAEREWQKQEFLRVVTETEQKEGE